MSPRSGSPRWHASPGWPDRWSISPTRGGGRVCSPADRTSARVGALDAHRQRGPQRRPSDRMLQTAEKVYKYLTWAYDRLTIARLGARAAGRGSNATGSAGRTSDAAARVSPPSFKCPLPHVPGRLIQRWGTGAPGLLPRNWTRTAVCKDCDGQAEDGSDCESDRRCEDANGETH
jgi:hypothetical protein